ncbi:lytic transglycosylase domain-containing protein [Sulfuricurvum sp.]|uniref:lytic transglycosylase domain-containing protein n=1 Tax=Sulfuricurvum sp. TaxID=2025608 RepID=UPI00263076C9|nr:lytic transglycosylase domain-containing protein [Sulfuricurvum sp.]MDD2781039.1 lytic transglycosylase domain-containing protein [Sulfuricurvum sp.]
MLKLLWLTLLFFSHLTLFARSDVEAINLSLQSLQSDESLLDTSALDNTLDRYRGTIKPLYHRYTQTTIEFEKIKSKFEAEDIPVFFALIPYSESKFNPTIRGYGTAGLWQFGKQSARNFGLTVKKGNDERLNPSRSTDAAIRYIKYLKKEFGSWYLADFAYAMGEGTLKRLIQKNGSKKISVLLNDPHFPSGTKAHFAKTLLLDAKIHYTKVDEDNNESK